MKSNMGSILRAAGVFCAAVCVAFGLTMTATVTQAEAKAYAERGTWEGSVYVSRPKAKRAASYQEVQEIRLRAEVLQKGQEVRRPRQDR